ncbi:DUF4178 domain-containing protein [Rhodoflexus sp.]
METFSNSIVPYYIQRDLPFAVNAQVATLPEELQREFLIEYNRRSKNIIIPYVLHFFFPAHYLYLDRFLTQILFWFTFGGFFFWWFIDIFRIPDLVRKRNAEIADEVLRHILFMSGKMQTQSDTGSRQSTIATPVQPRNLEQTFDPTNITIEHLRTGFLLDYGLKTWQVVNQIQFDWTDGTSDKEYKLLSGNDLLYLNVRREGGMLDCRVGSVVNLYAIDSQLDTVIQREGNPPKVLNYADFTLYRESKLTGVMFNHAYGNKPVKVVAWDYLDQTRTYHLRIERDEYQKFLAIFSKRASDWEFSEILPGSDR